MKRWVRRLIIWIPLGLVAALVVFALTPLGRYLVRAGLAEAKILLARRPIAEAMADTAIPKPMRDKLALVLEARKFAVDSLGLNAGESFTQFTQLDRDTLVLVLSAAPKDRLLQHTWWFPVVGRLPYKGFFDYDRGKEEMARMARDGYDVNLRPASAFSTLGWFNDPLLSTTLAADSIDLVDTVIHELTHNTFFARGEATFNESFANFVGARGSAQFFRTRGDTIAPREAEARWYDQQVLGRFWAGLYRQLDSLFNMHPDDKARRLAIRDSFYVAARATMVDSLSKEVRAIPRSWFQRVRLDNAALLARRVYATDLEVFDQLYEIEGKDIRRSITRVREIAAGVKQGTLSAAMRSWVQSRRPTDGTRPRADTAKPDAVARGLRVRTPNL